MSKEIAKWLKGLGLAKYAGLFDEQEIDLAALPELDETDLKELGIPLGPRKKILKAIAGLEGAERSQAPTHDSDASLAAWERMPGERKPVTMLFADITGSTALTEKLDAEETHDLLYGATQRMCASVENNRGTVCRFMGDGVMAMFGAPLASEHHAVDACQAAWEMQQAIGDYSKQIPALRESGIRIRVGLHSGEVVVLTVGEGEKIEYDASGPTVPVAARLEQAAQPGAIYLSAATRELAESRIEVGPLQSLSVKGISEPLAVFALRRVISAEESTSPARSTPFVGRRAELNQFRGILDTCLEYGQGQTVYVRGEPGIGKTRLTEEFVCMGAARGMKCHRGLVLDFGVGKGQDAIRALLRSLLGIGPGAGKDARLRAAQAAMDDGLLESDQQVYLNDLLDLPQATELRALYDAMDNATRNEGKQQVVPEIVDRLSSTRPVLLLVEDIHWADALTLAHLARLTKSVVDCAVLLLMTSRVEGDPLDQRWRSSTEGSPLLTIDLGPLRKQESLELIEGFIDSSDPLARDCLERAAGNPLFLEQLLRNAREGTREGLPDSIQSLVLARMDRLEPEDKRALQAASVIGQRFNGDVLCHLLDTTDYDCQALLEHNLVRTEGTGYLFAHALIQECVYSSLLKRQRGELHRKAAHWYSRSDSALHAEHLAGAEDDEAPGAFLAAAREQLEQFRFERALHLTDRGLAVASAQSDRHRLNILKGELLHDLGNIDSSIDIYREALEQADDDVQRCESWIGLAAGMRVATDYEAGLELLDKAEPVVVKHNLTLKLARLLHLRGNLHFPLGNVEACREAHQSALDYARAAQSLEFEARALGGLGDAAYVRGRMRTANDHYNNCVELSRKHGLGRVEMAHLPMWGFTLMYLGDLRGGMSAAFTALDAARKAGDQRVQMNAEGCICHTATDLCEYELLELHAEHQMACALALGSRTWQPTGLLWKAMALQRRGRNSEARELLMQAASIAREVGQAFNAGRVLGALALVSDDEEARDAALEEGEAVLRKGAVSHNYLWFYRFGMDALISACEWQRVEAYADALEDYTRAEPLPWSDFFIDRGRALAAFGQGSRAPATIKKLEDLRDQAHRDGFRATLPALEEALSRAGVGA
ncbi:MAG: tetratricopeptide repeat protein [Gammaproteobacteria bacterium]|nr:tetratricopeptide repeat protein [Gammaproteobacteria bacterium]NIM72733.1 tetratricopeptide repeat protein [Gammaproteobacteria bacterium]NIN38190.1 tetratricopeptide repeat protein [Gammaproteobacteria bacterium]NIO24481.1 tetratricopeptide repeat protein [Gammaproteobacteria bacterium]NIO65090.1 tetratricopeptide repeat protein [Gammaproteobacteria bacterium]